MMQYDNYVQAEAEPTNDVIKYLYDIPEMQPLSIWWIIGLLSALALVLGPLDYLVLKKLDRLPMTWITSTLVIVLFSVGAYYGVERIRGGLMQVRTVTVTDAVQGQPNSCFSTTLGGIFAPASDSYRLSDLKSNQWFTALSPEEVRQNYGSYSDESKTRHMMSCQQQDGGNLPTARADQHLVDAVRAVRVADPAAADHGDGQAFRRRDHGRDHEQLRHGPERRVCRPPPRRRRQRHIHPAGSREGSLH